MATTQDGRLLKIDTPLGKDFLLLNTFSASEKISGLFEYSVELLHEETEEGYAATDVEITDILGRGITITIAQDDDVTRTFTGIVNTFAKRNRNTRFSLYDATIVPHVWLLTQKFQSRIFQHMSVQEILEEVFEGFDVSFEIQGDFERRHYCVQYRESDFSFASRLMEEEGFFYYFEHSDANHEMIIANTSQSHQDNPGKREIEYQIELSDKDGFVSHIRDLRTAFTLQSGAISYRDRNFLLPGNNLEASLASRYNVGDNHNMEIYDHPGGYARKYDGKDRMGGDSSGSLDAIFPDKSRTVRNTMEAYDSRFEILNGSSDCCALTAGYRFKLLKHPNSQLNQNYVLTSVSHSASQSPHYISDKARDIEGYSNGFTCIPDGEGAPVFRPLRSTPKPIVRGSQTAVVVGPAGEEIFTDEYGRVKVQFSWDRQGRVDEGSSCWIRVAQTWAGNGWGAMSIPRVGMEVLVDFLEGNPDQPIVSGCVYNPDKRPPYALPDEKTKSGVKSDSSKGGKGFNEIRFEDKKGKEQIFVHAQKDQDIRVRRDRRELVANDRHTYIQRDKREHIKRDEHRIVERDLLDQVERDYDLTILGNASTAIQKDVSNEFGGNLDEGIRGNHSEEVTGISSLKAGTIVLEADAGICLKVGGNFITISPAGIFIQGVPLMLNSGGAALPGLPPMLIPPLEPEKAHIADNADPGSIMPTYKNQIKDMPTWKKPSFDNPSHDPDHPNNKDKKSWIKIKLVDEQGEPVSGERYRITLPDGETLAEGKTNKKGRAEEINIDPGNCKITFPRLDGRSWDKK